MSVLSTGRGRLAYPHPTRGGELLSMMRQSLFALMLCAVADLVAGLSLGMFSSYLELVPGLLVLVPGAIGMRGNVYATLGSRLGTYLHTGELSATLEERALVGQLLFASVSQTLALSCLLALLAKGVMLVMGMPSVSVQTLLVISVLGGVFAAVVMLTATVLITTRSVRKGWDPDNITTPLITATGDLVTIPLLILAAHIVLMLGVAVVDVLAPFVVVLSAAALVLAMRKSRSISRTIVVESVPVLCVCALLSLTAGMILEHRLDSLLVYTSLFLLVPPLNEETGNLGSILAARLSSSHRLGLIESRLIPDPKVLSCSLALMLLGAVLFPSLGALVYLLSAVFSLGSPGLTMLVMLATVVGMVVVPVSHVMTYYLTYLSIRRNIDPDNVVIPLLTSAMDLITTGVLMLAVIWLLV